jgi:hypothetical protein
MEGPDTRSARSKAIEKAIEGIRNIKVGPLPDISQLLKSIEKSMTDTIRPGKYLLGSPEEEKKYLADLQNGLISPTVSDSDGEEDWVEAPCQLCGRDDPVWPMLTCDGCDENCHTRCAQLDGVPEEGWYCDSCEPFSEGITAAGLIQIHQDIQEDDLYGTDAGDEIIVGGVKSQHPRLLGVPEGSIRLPDGVTQNATHYFGSEWVGLIVCFDLSGSLYALCLQLFQHALYNVPLMECPPNMRIAPHDHQLKGAAQIDHCCKGRFRGMILADAAGLGKTLTATLAMWKTKDEPGMSLVVAPAGLCSQWVRMIETSWEEVSPTRTDSPLVSPLRGRRELC